VSAEARRIATFILTIIRLMMGLSDRLSKQLTALALVHWLSNSKYFQNLDPGIRLSQARRFGCMAAEMLRNQRLGG
jgi:hypothetical protein